MALYQQDLTAQDLADLQAAVTGLGSVTVNKLNEVWDWLLVNAVDNQQINSELEAAGHVYYESVLRLVAKLNQYVPNHTYTTTMKQHAWDQYNFLSNHITITEPPFTEPV